MGVSDQELRRWQSLLDSGQPALNAERLRALCELVAAPPEYVRYVTMEYDWPQDVVHVLWLQDAPLAEIADWVARLWDDEDNWGTKEEDT